MTLRLLLLALALSAGLARAQAVPEVALQADLARLQSATLVLHERAAWIREHSRAQLVVATVGLDEARAKRGDTPRFAADKERWSECWKSSAPLLRCHELSGPLLKQAELSAALSRGASEALQGALAQEVRRSQVELYEALERRTLEVEVWRTAGERIAGDATITRGVAAAEAFLAAAQQALEHLRSLGADQPEPAPETEAPPPTTEPEER